MGRVREGEEEAEGIRKGEWVVREGEEGVRNGRSVSD